MEDDRISDSGGSAGHRQRIAILFLLRKNSLKSSTRFRLHSEFM
ncbi:hypothetical protein RUMOBE_00816 [Blautia obeum ATCC 29174]|uniref:Uncharacterized protein n=1 Tax=Blautia obeum ATCC 29174 TaxID=411459 RepID=A5ZP99_9FIRM|nr:hypothetical protein RUMOBE_00816 [Blautia obeum ATCC 29174]